MSIDNDKGSGANTSAAPALPPEADQELLLHRYLDGRLDEQERSAVDKWLKSNASARRTLDALREEDNLLRGALETRLEPSKRLADKVLATLYNEERVRLHLIRGRRLRRQVFAVLSAAASIFLCLWLVQPRDAAGMYVSGTAGVTLLTDNGARYPFTKNTPIYDGDTLITDKGQFVRVQLHNGAHIDLDESSRLRLEKLKLTTVRMLEGRMGVNTAEMRHDLTVQVPQGTLRIYPDSLLDIWLPAPSEAVWPEVLAGPAKTVAKKGELADAPLLLTAIKGMALVVNEQVPEGYSVASDGQSTGLATRALISRSSRLVRPIKLSASRVLETRMQASWHALDNIAPTPRVAMGLLERPDFLELGRRLSLAQKSPVIEEALKTLQQAMRAHDARERAEKLAGGQSALRAATAGLSQEDECRRFGRMLEGLAHLQRGLALAGDLPVNRLAAHDAFGAGVIAFEEAQQPIARPNGEPAPKPSWPQSVKSGPPTLAELSPTEQCALMASFYQAAAKYWRACSDNPEKPDTALALEAAEEFSELAKSLGTTLEMLGARFGEALAFAAANDQEKAISLLQQLVVLPIAGSAPAARQSADGLRQAALLKLVALEVAAGRMPQADAAAQDFWILYPLESEGAVARDIQRALEGERLKNAEEALRHERFQQAANLFHELLLTSPRAELQPELRLNLVRALIGLKQGTRALAELEKLQPTLPSDRRAEFESLSRQAKELPTPPSTPAPQSRSRLGLPETRAAE